MKFERGVLDKPTPAPDTYQPAAIERYNLLSLDVGFAKMGWAIFKNHIPVKCGVVINKMPTGKTARVSDEHVTRASFMGLALQKILQDERIAGIVGELPSGGARDAHAAIKMNMAIAVVGAVTGIANIPAEWCTPSDVKIATCGRNDATKQMMMDRISDMYGGVCYTKEVGTRKTKNYPDGIRTDYTYDFLGERYGVGKFEHIADACGAYLACADGNLIKLLSR